ncbi:hypothetical protein [Streptomyces lavendofoliae]|uniref:Secreted protein n=1 Tax=Streptomyces lavendofoliae TaxID=67314 RepID=A0A918I3N7_9ACTN|nr:hypothetical protein [Streptomyces lavendofoliae]GGU58945.1 hypothetical protein GCM10010274_54790 [Streptomyces lavendofoliae]
MRDLLMSAGTLAAAGLLTVGLTTSASAATGTAYMTQAGRTTTYTNPAPRTCMSSDPAKGDVTFGNRTDKVAWVFHAPGCEPGYHVEYLRIGQTLTRPAGWSVVFVQ